MFTWILSPGVFFNWPQYFLNTCWVRMSITYLQFLAFAKQEETASRSSSGINIGTIPWKRHKEKGCIVSVVELNCARDVHGGTVGPKLPDEKGNIWLLLLKIRVHTGGRGNSCEVTSGCPDPSGSGSLLVGLVCWIPYCC